MRNLRSRPKSRHRGLQGLLLDGIFGLFRCSSLNRCDARELSDETSGFSCGSWRRQLEARAQQSSSIRRIDLLMLYPETDPQGELRARVFLGELEKSGWKVGGNLVVNFHWGTGDAEWV